MVSAPLMPRIRAAVPMEPCGISATSDTNRVQESAQGRGGADPHREVSFVADAARVYGDGDEQQTDEGAGNGDRAEEELGVVRRHHDRDVTPTVARRRSRATP
jgi:hypothetical protein